MFSKTVFVAAALAAGASAGSSAAPAPSGTPEFPACWATCFAEYDIKSKDCLCKASLKDVVSTCIASGCSEADTATYEGWLASYCNVVPVSSNTWPAPSSYIPLPSSYAVPSSYPDPVPSSYPAPVPSSYPAPVPSSYPAPVPSGSYPAPVPSGGYSVSSIPYPSYSVCTSTSVCIWRSTTAYSSVVVTKSYDGASSWAVATGTGAAGYPSGPVASYAPVPATGAGAQLAGAGFGVVALVAGFAAVLL